MPHAEDELIVHRYASAELARQAVDRKQEAKPMLASAITYLVTLACCAALVAALIDYHSLALFLS
jgi:hypothetical protein